MDPTAAAYLDFMRPSVTAGNPALSDEQVKHVLSMKFNQRNPEEKEAWKRLHDVQKHEYKQAKQAFDAGPLKEFVKGEELRRYLEKYVPPVQPVCNDLDDSASAQAMATFRKQLVAYQVLSGPSDVEEAGEREATDVDGFVIVAAANEDGLGWW